MCGMDHTAPVERKRLKSGEFVRLDHAKRDMQKMLESIAYRVKEHDVFLLSDERPMLLQIAQDYGLEWPDEI